jgi:hypothetical protein
LEPFAQPCHRDYAAARAGMSMQLTFIAQQPDAMIDISGYLQ